MLLCSRRHLLVLTALLGALPAVAQPERAAVSGTVRDAASGETLIQASVRVEGTALGAATNAQGFYALAGLPPGPATLVVSHIGYEPARRTVELAAGRAVRVDFELAPATVEGGEVVVEAEKPLDEERAVGLQEVPIQLIQQIPSAIENDLFRSLQLLPGVKAASDFSSRLYIRGGSPDQTLILLDQTTVYNPTHFFGFFSTFNTDAIKDVRVFKGGYPAEYGGRLGSVIDVYNRDGNRNRLDGKLSLGLLASRVNVEGPIGAAGRRGSWFVAARRSTLEPLLAALREREENIPDGFYFYDVNAKVGLDLSPNDRLSLAAYAGLDDVAFPFAENARFDLRYGNQTGSLRYTRIFSDRVFTTLRATASRYVNFPEADIAGTTFRRDNRINDYSLKGDVEWLPARDVALKTGFWGGRLRLSLTDAFDGVETFRSLLESDYASGYAEAEWKPGRWLFKGGLRTQYFSGGDFLRFEPRLSIERYLTADVLAQAAYGRYYQFLALISNEAFAGFDVWVTTDDGVPPSYGDQFVLGLKTRPLSWLNVDVEGYYRTLRDLFEIDPEIQDAAGVDYPDLFRRGDGYAAGLEVLVEKRRGRLTGFVGYTLGTTQRRFRRADGRPVNPDPQTREPQFFSPKWDRRHDVSVVANYDLGRGWGVTAAAVYATGQAYTPVTGTGAVKTLVGVPSTFLQTPGVNRARLPEYHRVDLGVTRRGSFFGIGEYEARLQGINVYSRRNLWFYFTNINENPIEITPARQLPFLPNLSLTVDF